MAWLESKTSSTSQVKTDILSEQFELCLRLVVTSIIVGKTLLSLKPVVRTLRSYKKAGLTKRQKSFQELAMYGYEVMMSLQKRAKLFGTHFSSEVAVKSGCVFVEIIYYTGHAVTRRCRENGLSL
jgi:hypothetical protein